MTDNRLSTPAREISDKRNNERITKLMSMLRPGRENVTPSQELMPAFGMKVQTDLGSLVGVAREKGYPIGSIHAKGYFIMQDEEDLAVTVEHLIKRRNGIDITIARLERNLANAKSKPEPKPAPEVDWD